MQRVTAFTQQAMHVMLMNTRINSLSFDMLFLWNEPWNVVMNSGNILGVAMFSKAKGLIYSLFRHIEANSFTA